MEIKIYRIIVQYPYFVYHQIPCFEQKKQICLFHGLYIFNSNTQESPEERPFEFWEILFNTHILAAIELKTLQSI